MKKETRIFITYLYPGAFFPEELTKQVKTSDIPKKVPSDCFGFKFYQTDVVIDDNGKEYIGKSKSIGKTYIIGESIHVDDIPLIDRGQDTDTLKSNIRNNSPTKTAIKTHLGNWQMEDGGHVSISPKLFTFDKPDIYQNIKK